MTNRTYSRMIAGFGFALTIVACGEPPVAGPAETAVPEAADALLRGGPVTTFDARMAEVAASEPAFAGIFRNADGRITVALTDRSKRGAAEDAVRSVFASTPQLYAADAVVDADYGFTDLYAWKMKLTQVLNLKGVHGLDIDERANRLVLMVDGSDRVDVVLGEIARLGVPLAATSVRVEEPAVFAALPTAASEAAGAVVGSDLRAKWRPVPGGPELNSSGAQGPCTLGFNGLHNGKRAFATNGHCTEVQGGTEGTGFGQDDWSSDAIGTEYFEEDWFSSFVDPACPSAIPRCKYTDLALGEYNSSIDWTYPFVLRPVERDAVEGSIQTSGFLEINLHRLWPLQGQIVDKIGQKTGWTFGPVTESCVTRTVQNRYFICTYTSNGGAQSGDSGAGVYIWPGGSTLEVTGQLFAAFENGIGFLFSPWNSIATLTRWLDAGG